MQSASPRWRWGLQGAPTPAPHQPFQMWNMTNGAHCKYCGGLFYHSTRHYSITVSLAGWLTRSRGNEAGHRLTLPLVQPSPAPPRCRPGDEKCVFSMRAAALMLAPGTTLDLMASSNHQHQGWGETVTPSSQCLHNLLFMLCSIHHMALPTGAHNLSLLVASVCCHQLVEKL